MDKRWESFSDEELCILSLGLNDQRDYWQKNHSDYLAQGGNDTGTFRMYQRTHETIRDMKHSITAEITARDNRARLAAEQAACEAGW